MSIECNVVLSQGIEFDDLEEEAFRKEQLLRSVAEWESIVARANGGNHNNNNNRSVHFAMIVFRKVIFKWISCLEFVGLLVVVMVSEDEHVQIVHCTALLVGLK